jgi:Xaa-Pro aminopeptidase
MAADRIHPARVKRLAKEVAKRSLGGIIVVPGPNMRYLTGVSSFLLERPFMLFVTADAEQHLLAPTFEAGPYRRSGLGIDVYDWTDSQGPEGALGRAIAKAGVKGKWGAEGRAPYLYLSRLLGLTKVELGDGEELLQGLRETKDQEEVKLMKRSAEILTEAYDEFPGMISAGMTEAEFAKRASDLIVSKGAEKVDNPLVQSGARAADPHATASDKKIGWGESVIVDISSVYKGYYADMTRTFCLGNSPEVEKVYGMVLEAQRRAIDAAGPGSEVAALDGAARGFLKKEGLDRYFTHRTGHGLGLEVHEAPYIVEGGKEKLGRNMFFTVEPGVYIPGKLGVRIEDDLGVGPKAAEVITRTPKEYGWWT